MGGVFNTVNLHLYHYAGNNPVKYTDPDGLSEEEADLLQKATEYFTSTVDGYIKSLKEEVTTSGRGALSANFETTINGIKVKGSFAGVAEYNFSEGDITYSLVAGLDIGLGTPGKQFLGTGAEAMVGLRASFGEYDNKDIGRESNFGLRSISLALNAGAEFLGVDVKFEHRREILNFDTPSGSVRFTFLDQNKSKAGIGSDRQIGRIPGIGAVKLGGGGRLNGF
jgi:hypothetical protein